MFVYYLVCWYGDHVYVCTYVCCNNNIISPTSAPLLYVVTSARCEISASAGVNSLTVDTQRTQAGELRRESGGGAGGAGVIGEQFRPTTFLHVFCRQHLVSSD